MSVLPMCFSPKTYDKVLRGHGRIAPKSASSGGARVFAGRTNACVAASANQISSVIKYFSGFGSLNQPLGSPPIPSPLISSLPVFSPPSTLTYHTVPFP